MKAILFTLATVVQAKFMACEFGFSSSFLQGFAQGFQEDMFLQTSDCYLQAYRLEYASRQLMVSAQPSRYTSTNWAEPVHRTVEMFTQLTNEFTTCQSTDFFKQMQSRLTTIPGATDLGVKIGMMFLKQYISPGQSDMYNAFSNYFTA